MNDIKIYLIVNIIVTLLNMFLVVTVAKKCGVK